MAKNIEPKLKKIGDYLKLEEDTVFTIPEYQRAYSWSIENCDKLWQDINDFVESESKDIENAGFQIAEICVFDTPKNFPSSGFQVGMIHLKKGIQGDIKYTRINYENK